MTRMNPLVLINHAGCELLPAALVASRTQATQRILANAHWLIRRKSDGRFLAALMRDAGDNWRRVPLQRDVRLDELPSSPKTPRTLSSLDRERRLASLSDRLGVPGDYAERTNLSPVPEPARLIYAQADRYRRPLWLEARSAPAWLAMRAAAKADGLLLEAISGYRSWDYQAGILCRKLAAGQTLAQILAVNTAPGFSEHHSGRAIDIGAQGEPPAAESFEQTPQFAWLSERAAEFGFYMSYPRENPHGVIYEPWHWCWQPPAAGSSKAAAVD